jgi:cell division protein FtsZ
VIGVGGGGCNAVNRMIEQGLNGVEFITVNTDAQALSRSLTENQVHLGETSTSVRGRAATRDRAESRRESEACSAHAGWRGYGFRDRRHGRRHRPGVAFAVAHRSHVALTVGTVTLPSGAWHNANGASRLKDQVDTLIVIPNDRLQVWTSAPA